MTLDAAPASATASHAGLDAAHGRNVCDLSGVERFIVWAVRWESSLHDDPEFAHDCLQESFERAGLGPLVPEFRGYVAAVQGQRTPASPASRMGCWRINAVEATTLHAIACLQTGLFGDAWRAVSGLCTRTGATRALLALGELAEELSNVGGHIRPWPGLTAAPRG
jgi:hypothetical protein